MAAELTAVFWFTGMDGRVGIGRAVVLPPYNLKSLAGIEEIEKRIAEGDDEIEPSSVAVLDWQILEK